MKSFFAKLKKILSAGTKKAVETLDGVVDRLDWAEKEIKEAEEKLVELAHRLHNGIVELESVVASSQAIVQHHGEILEKAVERKAEYETKGQKVADLINAIHDDIK